MKWTDIVSAISSVVSNIIALAALVISLRRPPRHGRGQEGSEHSYCPEPSGSILFHDHYEDKHHIRGMRHHMRPDVGYARLRRKTMAGRTVRTRRGHLEHRHTPHGQKGRQ